MRVLVVDDDTDFCSYIWAGLTKCGVVCERAGNAAEALAQLDRTDVPPFDLILLDVRMPDQSGWEVLQELRDRGSSIPVIFLSGLDGVEDKVRGLRLGADDYIAKSCDFLEIYERVAAVVRCRRGVPMLEHGGIKLDLLKRTAWVEGARVDLSPREFDLLWTLISNPGETITRPELLRRVWNSPDDPRTNVVNVHVGRLRRKLSGHGISFIETVVGHGYRMTQPRSSGDGRADSSGNGSAESKPTPAAESEENGEGDGVPGAGWSDTREPERAMSA